MLHLVFDLKYKVNIRLGCVFDFCKFPKETNSENPILFKTIGSFFFQVKLYFPKFNFRIPQFLPPQKQSYIGQKIVIVKESSRLNIFASYLVTKVA